MAELTPEQKQAYISDINRKLWDTNEPVTDEEQSRSMQYYYELHPDLWAGKDETPIVSPADIFGF
jgi:hypothetical protein